MIVNFDDYLFEELLNESMINEEINYDKIKNIIGKIRDKKQAIYNLIKKFNESNNMHVRKYLATIIILLFVGNMVVRNSIWSNASGHELHKDVKEVAMELSKQNNLNIHRIQNIVAPILSNVDKPENQKLMKANINNVVEAKSIDISKVKSSYSVKKFIKEHEKLRLTAYPDHGMVTIGWGHAEYPKDTKMIVGKTTITEKEAEALFAQDILRTEKGVKRVLQGFKDVKITQNMFDAMVSIAFNTGVYGFMQLDFLDNLKNKEYLLAAEKIKTANTQLKVKNKKGKYVYITSDGLIDRRMAEAELFLKGIS